MKRMIAAHFGWRSDENDGQLSGGFDNSL